ncbi:MAG TPA: M23 family metallopeptidase [Terriglobia bacterium]|nr:M23 family metallopeptidase [Terriglobia bacterium]
MHIALMPLTVLTALLAFSNSIAVPQGSAFELKVPHVDGIQKVTATWQKKEVPLARQDDVWVALIGVDLDLKAGPYTAKVDIARDGKVTPQTISVEVTPVQFPTRVLEVEPKYVDPPAEELKRINREAEELNKIHRTVTPEKFWSESFRAPLDGAVQASSFGARSIFNGQARSPHAGADLRAASGTKVLAANRGRVVLARDLYFTGNTVVIDHGLGVYSLYAHLSRIDVKVGAVVEKSQLLGLSGATGRVTGPHLHWGFKAQDSRVDPFSLVGIEEHVVVLEISQSR